MRTFVVLCKKRKYFTKGPPPQLEDLRKKFSLDANISCVMQETKIFHQGPLPQLEYLRKKFSLDANISCVIQETKIFHQGPPSTLVLLYCKFLINNHAVQFDGGRFKEEILCRCEHFLCYALNENISPRPPPPQK